MAEVEALEIGLDNRIPFGLKLFRDDLMKGCGRKSEKGGKTTQGHEVLPACGSGCPGGKLGKGNAEKMHIRSNVGGDGLVFRHIGRGFVVEEYHRIFTQEGDTCPGLYVVQGDQHIDRGFEGKHLFIAYSRMGDTSTKAADFRGIGVECQEEKPSSGQCLVQHSSRGDGSISGHAAYLNGQIHKCHFRTPATRRCLP